MASSPVAASARRVSSRRNPAATPSMSVGALRCRRKFLRFFPKGFRDETYLDWERGYKAEAHERWAQALGPSVFARLLSDGEHQEIARRAVARTNLLDRKSTRLNSSH